MKYMYFVGREMRKNGAIAYDVDKKQREIFRLVMHGINMVGNMLLRRHGSEWMSCSFWILPHNVTEIDERVR